MARAASGPASISSSGRRRSVERQSSLYGKDKVYMTCPMCGAAVYELNGQPGIRMEVNTGQSHRCPQGDGKAPGKTKVTNIG
jgi:hypothetical protein